MILKVPNFFAKDPISKNLTSKLLTCWFMCARLWLGVLCWHAHNTRFVSVRFLLVILSHSLSSCLCLSPSESLYFCTRFFSSGFLVSYPVLIRFVSFTIWCLLMNVSRLVFLSTSTARLYLLLKLPRFCDLLSYRCVFSLLSRPSFTHS